MPSPRLQFSQNHHLVTCTIRVEAKDTFGGFHILAGIIRSFKRIRASPMTNRVCYASSSDRIDLLSFAGEAHLWSNQWCSNRALLDLPVHIISRNAMNPSHLWYYYGRPPTIYNLDIVYPEWATKILTRILTLTLFPTLTIGIWKCAPSTSHEQLAISVQKCMQ